MSFSTIESHWWTDTVIYHDGQTMTQSKKWRSFHPNFLSAKIEVNGACLIICIQYVCVSIFMCTVCDCCPSHLIAGCMKTEQVIWKRTVYKASKDRHSRSREVSQQQTEVPFLNKKRWMECVHCFTVCCFCCLVFGQLFNTWTQPLRQIPERVREKIEWLRERSVETCAWYRIALGLVIVISLFGPIFC